MYTRVVQYGDVTELYRYSKDRTEPKPRYDTKIKKKRRKDLRAFVKARGQYERKRSSVFRSVRNFYRLCHHNNTNAKSIAFCTLTFANDLTYKKASRHVARFMESVKKGFPEIPVTYISVPELTKKNRFHFHLLIYDLPPEAIKNERSTRNFQMQFLAGYVDMRLASYTSTGIAGYMAKYMAKSFTDTRYQTTRAYNCSRGINKPTSMGSNTLDTFLAEIIPDGIIDKERLYEVPYLGQCQFIRIVKKKHE